MSENSFMVENWTSLPVDVVKNLMSYKLGETEYLKIQHNHIETLKRIQQRYKINRTERKTKPWTIIGGDNMKRHLIEYFISRKLPVSVKRINDLVFNEYETLDCLLDGIVGDEGYEVKLIVGANLFVRFHHFKYYEYDHFSTICYRFLSRDVVDNVTKDNLEDVLSAAHQEIYRSVDEFRNGMNFEGVKSLRFKLTADKPV